MIVEMTPQYRAAHHPKWTAQSLDELIGHQIKAVGQLIVDNEHMSGKDDCGFPEPESTCWRSSVWELHPVVEFYYCPSDNCAADSSAWVPLDNGVNLGPPSATPSTSAASFARVVSRADDGSHITLMPGAAAAPQGLTVAAKAQPQVRQLNPGDAVHVTAAPRGGDLQSVEIRTVPTTPVQRLVALVAAFAVVGLLLAVLRASPRQLILGEDGRYSKSKFQVFAWFVVLIAGYLATVVLRWWASQWTMVAGIGIPADLVVISGMSAFTFVGAKTVTTNKIAQSPTFAATKARSANVARLPNDLVNNDQGIPDLGDTQMILITLIAVGTYLAVLFSWWSVLTLSAHVDLPNIDRTLVAVFGLGQGAYLVKKQVEA
jgi:hypothetical protein